MMGSKSKDQGGNNMASSEGDLSPFPAVNDGDNLLDVGMNAKARRDRFEAVVSLHSEGIPEAELHIAQLMMALDTKEMAECGIAEDEKHSSLKYCEDNLYKMFFKGDVNIMYNKGGDVIFSDVMADAINSKRDESSKLKEDTEKSKASERGTEGQQLQQLQEKMSTLAVETENSSLGTITEDDLFKPTPPREDCPICMIPLPRRDRCTYTECCGKSLCDGCIYAHREESVHYTCPFCRVPCAGRTDEDRIKAMKIRIDANDAEACYMMAATIHLGRMGVKQDNARAIELYQMAAELGLGMAHHTLGMAYARGDLLGVEKDKKKSMHHFRLAAIGGELESRYALGVMACNAEQNLEERDRQLAMKHWIIGAEAGHDFSLEQVKYGYKYGLVTREAFAKALRAHQSAIEAVKSDQRDRVPKKEVEQNWNTPL